MARQEKIKSLKRDLPSAIKELPLTTAWSGSYGVLEVMMNLALSRLPEGRVQKPQRDFYLGDDTLASKIEEKALVLYRALDEHPRGPEQVIYSARRHRLTKGRGDKIEGDGFLWTQYAALAYNPSAETYLTYPSVQNQGDLAGFQKLFGSDLLRGGTLVVLDSKSIADLQRPGRDQGRPRSGGRRPRS